MLKRLLAGLVFGTVIGGVMAAIMVQGLGVVVFTNPFYAYGAAAATGLLSGLVAGKPIWSGEGRIEAGLKAFFGVLLSLAAMFALRTWVHASVDFHAIHPGMLGEVGNLPAASLPAIGAVLSAFFELDNTPNADGGEGAKGAKAAPSSNVRVADEAEEEDDQEEQVQGKKKR